MGYMGHFSFIVVLCKYPYLYIKRDMSIEGKLLTKREQMFEFIKCYQDPIYAIEKYFKTFDKTNHGFVRFKLFPRQQEVIQSYMKYQMNLVTKPRQAGVSTTTAAYVAINTAFADENNPEKILILANKQDLALEFLSKIKDFLLQVPRWVWGPDFVGSEENLKKSIFVRDSQKLIELPNGCKLKAVATSKDALRGYTPTFLIMDEAAHIDNGAEVFGAALTSLGTGGKCTLISTPNGLDELYYRTYEGAKRKDKSKGNSFHVVEMRWYEDLRYNRKMTWHKGDDVEPEVIFTIESYKERIVDGWKPHSPWYDKMCMDMNHDARMIAQELDVSFVGSGGNVIDNEYIEAQEKTNVREPIREEGLEKDIWIWNEPVEGHRYILSADVSRGDSADYSSFSIVDFETMEQVVEYQGKMPPDLFGQLVNQYGLIYSAYVVVDITGGMGVATILKLLELGYKNLHYDAAAGNILRDRDKLDQYSKGGQIPGFNINANRLPMIANFEQAIRENTIKIRSNRIIQEMKTFIFKKGRPDHMDGYHDDCLIAMAMALWVMQNSFKKLERLQNQTKAMLGAWGVSSTNSDAIKKREMTGGQAVNLSLDPPKKNNTASGDNLWLFTGMK